MKLVLWLIALSRRRRNPPRSRRRLLATILAGAALALPPATALAWGDQGHEIIALIADHFLGAKARDRLILLLSADTSRLTRDTGIAAEATWADKYRDSDRNGAQRRYLATRDWHFVDLELDDPDLDVACFGQRRVAVPAVASAGPAQDCIVDKIEEFGAELRAAGTAAEERRIALQFLLHLVGDVHQPLHASDDHDQGGNGKRIVAPGARGGNLHHFWDTELVRSLGAHPSLVAARLIAEITPAALSEWSGGTPAGWARESFDESRAHAYGSLPRRGEDGVYHLSAAYLREARSLVQRQLSRAGVRLAFVINGALDGP